MCLNRLSRPLGIYRIRRLTFVFALFPYFPLSKEVIELVGRVEESFPNATFRVRVMLPNGKEHELLCHLAGRMRLHRVRILPGDRVKVEMTPYDLEKGRIVFRLPSQQEEERLRRLNEGTGPISPTSHPR